MPLERPDYPLRLTIDAAALADNWRVLDRLSGKANAGAAVKADGYGLGARRVVPLLWQAGCRTFFVAHWAEAADLLDLVPPGSIAVLHGPMSAQDAAFGHAAGLRPVINSLAQARLWHAAGGGVCDLMVDTGINRLGLPLSDLADPVITGLAVDTLHSHLACAEEQSPLNEVQRSRWVEACQQVPHLRASLANSAGIMLGADYHGTLTRPGLAIYGGVPCEALAGHIRQVAQPEAQLIQRRRLQPGDSVGYNARFTATAPLVVGVVSLGYADGYLRCTMLCTKKILRNSSILSTRLFQLFLTICGGAQPNCIITHWCILLFLFWVRTCKAKCTVPKGVVMHWCRPLSIFMLLSSNWMKVQS